MSGAGVAALGEDGMRVAVAWAAAALVLRRSWPAWGFWGSLTRSAAVAFVSCFSAGLVVLLFGDRGPLGAVCMGLFAWPLLSLFRDDAAGGAVLAALFAIACWLFWWIG